MATARQTPRPYSAYGASAYRLRAFHAFFLLGCVWAAASLGLSVTMIFGAVERHSPFDPITYYFHELIFGAGAAVAAGVVHVALPRWTRRPPIAIPGALSLIALWVAGRLAVLYGSVLGAAAVATIDLGFLLALLMMTAGSFVFARSRSGAVAVLVLALLLAANGLSHAAHAGLFGQADDAQRSATAVLAGLIVMVSGVLVRRRREVIVPWANSFRSFGFHDLADAAAALTTAIGLALWVAAPTEPVTTLSLAAAAAANTLRLVSWCRSGAGGGVLNWGLLIGYAWIPAGLALAAAAPLWPAIPAQAAPHAVATGALGATLAVLISGILVARAGRTPPGLWLLAVAFLLINGAAVLRIAGTALPEYYHLCLAAAASAWITGFAICLAVCAPAWLGARPAPPRR